MTGTHIYEQNRLEWASTTHGHFHPGTKAVEGDHDSTGPGNPNQPPKPTSGLGRLSSFTARALRHSAEGWLFLCELQLSANTWVNLLRRLLSVASLLQPIPGYI